jgi:hypothetical protein
MRKSAPVAFLAAGFLIFTGLIAAAPAYADDEEDDTSSEVIEVGDNGKVEVHLPHPPKPVEQKRKELEEKYGKQGRLSVPPLVIRPMRDTDDMANEPADSADTDDVAAGTSAGTGLVTGGKVNGAGAKVVGGQPVTDTNSPLGVASARFIAINPVSAGTEGAPGVAGQGRQVNPEQNTAIDISTINFTRKTPADAFIQSAAVGLYAMAAGAVVLAIFAATRAIRRK